VVSARLHPLQLLPERLLLERGTGAGDFEVALDDASLHLKDFGSNGWVIGPAKSATGHAMLFINPHLPFFGSGQVYEGHIKSDEGWNFTGYTRFGFPFPYVDTMSRWAG
jgi:acyl-homoserine lactone acylase PvdQ